MIGVKIMPNLLVALIGSDCGKINPQPDWGWDAGDWYADGSPGVDG
jgi:hypothetical protein